MLPQAHLLTTIFLLIDLITCPANGQGLASCTWDEASCGCQTDQGLISLWAYEDGLQAVESSGGGTIYWSPCKDFTKDGLTAACMQYFSPSLNYDCGVHESMTSSVADGGYAKFTMFSEDYARISKVNCVCGSAGRLEFVGEDPTGTYNLKLDSEHCCPGYSGSGSSGLSGGSILLIVALCLVFVYLAGGIAVQTLVRKAEGIERIPNVGFWSTLPLLIVDGIKFTFSCGKSSSHQRI